MAHGVSNGTASSPQNQGVLLLGVIVNAFFSGIVTKQQYLYWTNGFKDPIYVRALVVAQCFIVILQIPVLWISTWRIYITIYAKGYVTEASTWGSIVNSACQTLLIVMANTFLASRIYNLTGSHLKARLVFGLSFTAFIIGVPVIVIGWHSGPNGALHPLQRAAAVVWHGLQATAEVLIMYFLSRALLSSRSGLQGSDRVVHHLVRSVIQIGLFAVIWSVAALSTYFLLPNDTIYAFIDTTSGLIYTHMIFDGLLARRRLREMAGRTESGIELEMPSQSLSLAGGGKGTLEVAQDQGAIPLVNLADSETRAQDVSKPPGMNTAKDDISECEPVARCG